MQSSLQRAKMFILLSFIEAHKIAIKVYSRDNASVQSNSPQPQPQNPPHHTNKSHSITLPHMLCLALFHESILNYEWKLKCNMRLIKTLSSESKRAKLQMRERGRGKRVGERGSKLVMVICGNPIFQHFLINSWPAKSYAGVKLLN